MFKKSSVFLLTTHSLVALTTLNVFLSTDNDPGEMGEPGDLRYCINNMNLDLNSIPDDYAITFDFPMTIQLNGILPIINNSLNPVNITIGNPGSIPTVTIDGNSGAYRGFLIPTGNVTIQNMIFQNLAARGGRGGDGVSGGGGGLGAGSAIYAPEFFLNGGNPSITLMNVSINSCAAIGGDGGNFLDLTGQEGGGGGGGFEGNGGSITTAGRTGGGGGGGFGGNGGNATLDADSPYGGGGGGGGGIGSRATLGALDNLGNGGDDLSDGSNGGAYGYPVQAGNGGGGSFVGGAFCGGGGGGGGQGVSMTTGGGGGGSAGADGQEPLSSIPPGASAVPSGGAGNDGGGGGGGGVVIVSFTNSIDGAAGNGGYGGGGGGGAGLGATDTAYTINGGLGGTGGGGGGGGVDLSGTTINTGGNSLGGRGGGGNGPSAGSNTDFGSDIGNLGGGSGGFGANSIGAGFGGGGGGGGSGLGGAIFVDGGTTLTIQAIPGVPTVFNTSNNTISAGTGGIGGSSGGATDGSNGSALGESIFLRAGATCNLIAENSDDLLILGEGVSFVDGTSFGAPGTSIDVSGDGMVVYNGTTDYQGSLRINNAHFKVNGLIEETAISVCRNRSFSLQRGTLSGIGTLTGDVFVNSGVISPDTGHTLTLGSLILSPADPINDTLGSLVHIDIDSSGASLVAINGSATLAGVLEIAIDPSAATGSYTLLTSSGITGSFDSLTVSGAPSTYTLSYLPIGSPTLVQFEFLSSPLPPPPIPVPTTPSLSLAGLRGNNLRVATYLNGLVPNADSLGLTDQYELLSDLSFSQYEAALQAISPARNSSATFVAQNVMFMFSESLDSHFTKMRLAQKNSSQLKGKETAFLAENELLADGWFPRKTKNAPAKNTNSRIWSMGFGQFSHQNAQDQNPALDFNSGGLFLAYDYGNSDQGCIGALAGYAHSAIDESHSMGNSHLNAGYLSLYGMRFFSDYFLDAAIWGEYMGIDQKRKISFPGFNETAKSSLHAGQLDLHFGTGYDFNIRSGTIEPFALLDWVSEWDNSYSEKGASPYNMHVSSRHSWMLRFETGLNGYNTTVFNWGIFIAQAKLSYVYKKPHNVGQLNAAIVSAPTSFVVEAFTAEQSLFSPAIELFWQTNWNGFGSISYDGEYGSGYSSNQFYGKVGYSF